jgi:4-diphosphocytidyl-2-C-methyl-D-erythritol kinase
MVSQQFVNSAVNGGVLHCLAPAKINLFLHVTGRRVDGYHLLQSVMCRVDLCDELTFQLRYDGLLHLTGDLSGTSPENNLVIKAAKLLQSYAGVPLGVDIHLTKHIPSGAGLGGGSSDAATTLLALNKLWQLNYSKTVLQSLGLSLGADVPFFLEQHAAWVEGIGEKITPLSELDDWLRQQTLLLVSPNISVPTATIFNSNYLTRADNSVIIADFLRHTNRWAFGKNALEIVVENVFPAVHEKTRHFLTLLSSDVVSSESKALHRMSGSGACSFVPLIDSSQDKVNISEIQKAAVEAGCKVWLVKPVTAEVKI